jgi:NAD(P)-dependent dehydrogenase (short-subunit alcohol dehydrogenase family)
VSAAAKEAFSRLLAAELAPRNIRVVGIRPHAVVDAPSAGSYTADVFAPAAASGGQSVQEFVDGLAEGTLLKRLPTLAQIGETAAFLASDHAAAMTGTIVDLSAGTLTH